MYREDFIAGVLRAAKPTDRRLHDGWLYTCIGFARQFQAHNACFDALQFLTLCDLSLADEKKWREKYGMHNDPSAVA
jgi:hypothetical protein